MKMNKASSKKLKSEETKSSFQSNNQSSFGGSMKTWNQVLFTLKMSYIIPSLDEEGEETYQKLISEKTWTSLRQYFRKNQKLFMNVPPPSSANTKENPHFRILTRKEIDTDDVLAGDDAILVEQIQYVGQYCKVSRDKEAIRVFSALYGNEHSDGACTEFGCGFLKKLFHFLLYQCNIKDEGENKREEEDHDQELVISLTFEIENIDLVSMRCITKKKWLEMKKFFLSKGKKTVVTAYKSCPPMEFYGKDYSGNDLLKCIHVIENKEKVDAFKVFHGTSFSSDEDIFDDILDKMDEDDAKKDEDDKKRCYALNDECGFTYGDEEDGQDDKEESLHNPDNNETKDQEDEDQADNDSSSDDD